MNAHSELDTNFTAFTRRALVRCDFSEEATYRDVLGNAAMLHPFVTDGPLDAPLWIPSFSNGMPESRD